MFLMIKIIVILGLFFNSMNAFSQTKIIAHRGYSSIAPENTLAAFQKAIECKADYIELDVHKTKDDTIVVIHDSTIDRTRSNFLKKGKVAEFSYHDLKSVSVGYHDKFETKYQDEKIPTLREVLLLAKGEIRVCIEIKTFGIEAAILKLVNELEMRNEVILFAFDYPILVKIRQFDKTIPILYLVDVGDELTVDYAKIIGAGAIGVGNETSISKEFMNFAHSHGVEVWKWTVNEEAEMKHLIEVGLDGIITNYPEKALQSLYQTSDY